MLKISIFEQKQDENRLKQLILDRFSAKK